MNTHYRAYISQNPQVFWTWPGYRAFSCDVTVTWKPYGRPLWCTVEWRLGTLHDARAKCSPNLAADGLTSQVCLISLPGTCYMWDVSALAA